MKIEKAVRMEHAGGFLFPPGRSVRRSGAGAERFPAVHGRSREEVHRCRYLRKAEGGMPTRFLKMQAKYSGVSKCRR